MKINFQHAHFALLAAWVTLLFLLSGCAVTAPSQVSTLVQEGAENTSLGKSELPENITSSGILRVGSQETYVPAEFTDEGSGEITGFTVDLLKEITRRLGLKLEYVHAEYAALIPGLDAGRFDIGSGGMSPNPDRLDVVDMVGYFQSGATFLIRQEDQGKYSSAQDFCGKPVGAIQGATTLEKAIHLQNEECLAAGKPPIDLQFFTTTPDGLLQVKLNRIDAYLPDLAQALYIVKQDPETYATIGGNYYLVKYPITWTFQKSDDTRLRDAIASTLSDMMADGTYKAILDEWGVSAGAISKPAINRLTADQN